MRYKLNRLKILLVDDDSSMRFLVRDILLAFGVGDVQVSPDGDEAFWKFCRYETDIVIADWQMTPVSGLDLLKRIRSDPVSPNPRVPVIILTAHADPERVIECRNAGATSVLAKPIAPETLYRRIAWTIEGSSFLFPGIHGDRASDIWYIDQHQSPA